MKRSLTTTYNINRPVKPNALTCDENNESFDSSSIHASDEECQTASFDAEVSASNKLLQVMSKVHHEC